MYVSPDHALAVLTPPRAASRSTQHVLEAIGWRSSHGHHGIDPVACRRAQRVGVLVRNHWTVLASRFADTCPVWTGNAAPLTAWLGKVLRRDAARDGWMWPRDGVLWSQWLVWADEVIHVERLQAELGAFIGENVGPLPHIGQSSKPDYRTAYDEASRWLVGGHFANEIAACGYDFEGLACT